MRWLLMRLRRLRLSRSSDPRLPTPRSPCRVLFMTNAPATYSAAATVTVEPANECAS